jgi:predicted branched-subunit amino acid permease
MLPLLAGVAPMGLVIGVAVAEGGLPTGPGLATGWLIYSGSAQLAVLDLLRHDTPLAVVAITVLAINARLVLYGGALARHWRRTPLWWRLVGAYLIIDPSFLVGADGYRQRRGHAYYVGGAVVLWLGWQACIVTGLLVGSAVPAGLELEFVATLYLVAMAVLRMTDRPARIGIVAGAVAATVGTLLPLHAGPLVGIVVGVATALLWPSRTEVPSEVVSGEVTS